MLNTYTAYLVVGLQVEDLKLSPKYLKHVFSCSKTGKQPLYFEDWLDSCSNEIYRFKPACETEEEAYGFDVVVNNVKPLDLFNNIKAASKRFKSLFDLNPKIINILCRVESV